MKCASCGFENPAGFKFCGNCAKPLAPTKAVEPPPRDARAYTPKHLVEKILVSKSAIEGERKVVTVLFADVVRSMELAEQVDPEEWHGVLDKFFAILAEGVHRFEGTINQFTGDGIMALFGAPIAHEDHAQRACYAALHLSETLRRYGEEVKRTLGLGFAVRMGINSGEVVVGKIGDDLRMDYTAQGHTVGLAARMEQLAGADRTYVTEHTAVLVSPYFRLRDLGRFDVKGVREPIGVYELEGVGAVRTRLDVSRARGFSRFVGRGDEMKTLEEAFERTLEGAGDVIGVVGDAGVGKSRLCYELAERVRARGVRVITAHAPPHGKAIPLLPWIELYRNTFGITEEDGDETARDKIAGRIVRLDESLTEALPILFDFLGVPDPNRPAPPMDPEARSRSLIDISRRFLHARSRREAAVFLLEDLHWLDRASEGFLAAMIDTIPESRSLVLATFRPEYRPPWTAKPYYRALAIEPLGAEEIAELCDALLGRDPSLAELAARVRERAAGNPFFVEEIVRSLADAGVLAGARGAYRLAKPVDELEIPPSVQSILAARIDRLADEQKSVLQTAAVIGKNFGEPVLARVADRSGDELRGVLEDLVTAELVYCESLYPAAEYAFAHPLTQEVAYRSQLADRRARTHGRVARVIAELHADKLNERAALLAHHHEAAGEDLEAAKWHRRAARWIRRSNFAEASVHWRRVVELLAATAETPEVVELSLEARVAVLQAGWLLGTSAAEASTLFDESRALATRAGDARSVAILTAIYASIQAAHRRIDEYVRLSREAVRVAEETKDPALLAAVFPTLVRSHLLAGRLREALSFAEQGLAAIPEDPSFSMALGYSPYLNLLQLRANLLAYVGRWPEAVTDFERMIMLARKQSGQVLVDSGSSDYGWWAALLGDAATALAHTRRGLEVAERLGNQMTRVYAYRALGFAQVAARHWDDAIAALEQAQTIAREVRTAEDATILTLAHLAEAHLGRGDPNRAWELAMQSVSEADEHRVPSSECLARIVHARAALASGRAIDAANALDRAAALVQETGALCYEPLIRAERAKLGTRSTAS